MPPAVLKLVFFGTPDFVLSPLQALLQDERFEIAGVVTQGAKEAGRGLKTQQSPVHLFAEEKNTPVQTPETLKAPEFQTWLQNLAPDICLVASYGKIIPKSVLAIPKHGFINIHPSLLPKYRGATPVPYTLLHGEKKTGVTIMLLNEKMDEGDLLYQTTLEIAPADTSASLLPKLFESSAKNLGDILCDFVAGKIKPTPQDHTQATYTTLLTKEMGRIDWEKEGAEQIVNKIRAFTPWPGVYTFCNGKRLKILAATCRNTPRRVSTLGTVQEQAVTTTNGDLIPITVQPEGKKAMSWADFLRGQQKKTLLFTSVQDA